jgi:hypothetical protein
VPGDDAGLVLSLAARLAGIEIPEDLFAGVLHGYRGLREMTELLFLQTCDGFCDA